MGLEMESESLELGGAMVPLETATERVLEVVVPDESEGRGFGTVNPNGVGA